MKKDLHLKLTVRLYSDDDRRCFGPGIATLLRRVELHHSLRAAAASMEMAYSKAWRIIRTAEDVFGCKLLSSTIGGQHGGGAVLTPEARRLLAAYEAYVADVDAYSREKFCQAFDFCQDLSETAEDSSEISQ
ncbi:MULTISPECIES: LysR family transcriptional regulator [environmental samples]|uniref:winged helix-turn-helix domain-containing protein n=1 Tax=environmental samples TaxID=876090 RepID=UPI000339D7D2|nr:MULTISPECIES: LysR family transcriptional regulator [environmental samples]CDC71573.1 putative ModE family transcriptional regulator [Oscillibacter sp. CAG:155]